MKIQVRFLFAVIVSSILMPAILDARQDNRGGKDYPLFTRWPGYYIDNYKHSKFDAYTFKLENSEETVEGEYYYLSYYKDSDVKDVEAASDLAIIRNYENAIRKAGGTVLYTQGRNYTVGKIIKDGKEIWVRVAPFNGGHGITLDIVERQAMDQSIQVNAESWFSDISTTGRAVVYGIYFDTDKADIKAESEPAIAEMAKMLMSNATLNVFIVGHTDNTGTYDHNMKLSQDRAQAVVKTLINQHGIALTRLKGVGVGPLSPVASNKTEEGKAKNRRVELVEQ